MRKFTEETLPEMRTPTEREKEIIENHGAEILQKPQRVQILKVLVICFTFSAVFLLSAFLLKPDFSTRTFIFSVLLTVSYFVAMQVAIRGMYTERSLEGCFAGDYAMADCVCTAVNSYSRSTVSIRAKNGNGPEFQIKIPDSICRNHFGEPGWRFRLIVCEDGICLPFPEGN